MRGPVLALTGTVVVLAGLLLSSLLLGLIGGGVALIAFEVTLADEVARIERDREQVRRILHRIGIDEEQR